MNSLNAIRLKDGSHINIRELERRDVDGIWLNFNEAVEEKIYLPVYTPVVDEWEKNSWYQEINREGNMCIVAENPKLPLNRRIVGQCTIESLEWEAAEHVGILGIIVQKGYRDLGLGFYLIMEIKKIAAIRGKKKIILSTFETNSRGVALYKKCGFSVVGNYSRQYLINGHYINELLMETWLA